MCKQRVLAILLLLFCVWFTFAQSSNNVHVVKKGETLSGIANEHHVRLDSILKNNPKIKHPENIKEGDTIIITIGRTLTVTQGQNRNSNINVKSVQSHHDGIPTVKARNKPANTNEKKSHSLWWLWILLGCGGGVFCWEKWSREKFSDKSEAERYQKEVYELNNRIRQLNLRIEELEGQIKSLEQDKIELEGQIKSLEQDKIELEGQIKSLEQDKIELLKKVHASYANQIDSEKNQIIQSTVESNTKVYDIPDTISSLKSSESSIFYADCIMNGYFNSVKRSNDENAFFELHVNNMRLAKFSICSSAIQRAIANPSFLEGCDKQILSPATHLNVESEGEAQLQSDGRWKIIKKLIVIIS